MREKGPDGRITLNWFRQDDIRRGQPVRQQVGEELFYDGFDFFNTSTWASPNGWAWSERTTGDNALRVHNASANWNITANRTGTVGDGTVVLVQFKVSGATPEAVLALNVTDNHRWGIYVRSNNQVDAQWSNGGAWTHSTLLGANTFKRDVWYVLMLGVDNGTDLVRLWERDADPETNAVRTYQADAMSSGQNWQFKVYANNGSVYLDTYHEMKLLSESETTIATSPIALQSGWSLIDQDNKTLVGVNGYWTRPTGEKALTFNNDTKFVGRATDYSYDAYGNVTDVVEKAWNGSAFIPYRATKRGFYPNTTNWLVGLPGYENQYACPGGACSYQGGDVTSSILHLYDGQSSYSATPTTGKLTGNSTFICYANASNQCVAFGSHSKAFYSDADYGYDSYGNRTSQTVYTNYGNGVTRATTTARTTSFVYADGSRNTYKTSETNPAGHVTGWVYDYRKGVPTQETDPNGVVTTAEYDTFGRLTKIIRPGDSSATPTIGITYYDTGVNATGPFGIRLRQWHSGGFYTLYKFYDGLGQLIQQVTYDAQVKGAARDILVDREYNAYGQVTRQTMPYDVTKWGGSAGTTPYRTASFTSDKTTITSYDNYGRVTLVTPPTTGEAVSYSYNQDLTVVTRNPRGYDTTTVQDIWGRVAETRPYGATWLRYTYDAADRLTKVEKMNGSSPFAMTTMDYDMAGRKFKMIDMDMGTWTYGYDALGNLTSQTDARGCVTTLTYNDGLSRLTGKSYSGSCGVTTSAVTYGYDAITPSGNKGKGQRTSMSDGAGSTLWEYSDNRGRLSKETKTATGGGAFVTQWGYDSGDQVTSMTYPDGEVVNYSYLPQMVINSAVGNSTYVNESQYDAASRLELRKFGADQIRTDYKYRGWDTQGGRLEWTRSGTPSGSTVNATLQNFTYTYDPNGNVASIVDTLAGGTQTQSYGYDELDRLTTATVSGGAGGIYNQSYTYDSYGRPSTGPLGSGYTYDVTRKHAVAQVGSNSFGYDLNGNMTARTENGSSYTQNYDAENRLVSVTGATTANFLYDGDGNRVKGTVNDQITRYIGNHYEVSLGICSGQTTPGSTNWQAFTPTDLYVDVDTTACGFAAAPLYFTTLGGNSSHWATEGATSIYSPTPTGFRVYVRYTVGPITPAEAVASGWHLNWVAVSDNYHTLRKYYYAGGQRVAMRQNNTVYWLLGDHLGSTAYTVNGTTKTGETRYFPWGKDRFTSGSTLTSYKFTSQREEAGLGLYYYGARWYDPALGRFIQPDTIVPNPGDVQSFDRYAYVNNNPLRYTDPSGHDPLDASWEAEWKKQHCAGITDPTSCIISDKERAYRLYSLAYLGPASGSQTWTSADWAYMYANHNDAYQSTTQRESLSDFTAAINRLAGHYNSGEKSQFVSGIALLYAGWPYDPSGGNINDMALDFHNVNFGSGQEYYPMHGMAGFAPQFHNDGAENTHHFAGHVILGFHYGVLVNYPATVMRELMQNLTTQATAETSADTQMGYVAGAVGSWLASNHGSIHGFGSRVSNVLSPYYDSTMTPLYP